MEKRLQESSLFMGLMDMVPVVLFSISMGLCALRFDSLLFRIGVVLAVIGGMSKALWKVIMGVTKKDVKWMCDIFRPCMIGGFLILITGCILDRSKIDISYILNGMMTMPVLILTILCGVFFILMMVCALKMDGSKKWVNYFEQTVNCLWQADILLIVISLMK